MQRLRALSLAIALGLASGVGAMAPAFAVEPDEILSDPALEARARALSAELRCMVCQNQSIDDSQAPLAKDLRVLVRQRLVAGDSDAEVRRYLVDRYGNFILLKPPFETGTLLLWLTPGLVLLLGAGALVAKARSRATVAAAGQGAEASLTEAEKRRLEEMLKEG